MKPAAANPVDDLFGKKLHSAPLSQTGATLTGVSPTPTSSASTLPPPPPPPSQQPPVVLSSEQPQGHPSSQAASSEQKGSTESGEKREVQHTEPDPGMYNQKFAYHCVVLSQSRSWVLSSSHSLSPGPSAPSSLILGPLAPPIVSVLGPQLLLVSFWGP